ncbi:MAG: hypothetical protein IJS73_03805 [Paludibacteraceae bacterium]|nr:hypothetical protein [Paludibacteraceae bacterium]
MKLSIKMLLSTSFINAVDSQNESEFQESLLKQINDSWNGYSAVKEFAISLNKFSIQSFEQEKEWRIDIMLKDGETLIPIELKFVKKVLFENQNYFSQYAELFCKDICKVERLIKSGFCKQGYAIFVTNDKKLIEHISTTLNNTNQSLCRYIGRYNYKWENIVDNYKYQLVECK